ncbi:MAG: hypothetical protein COB17_03515 [Sulfurimonas sp.]|nr:MAG: hypothetical protein COB17_03515 [Sulfurimonas sp.]
MGYNDWFDKHAIKHKTIVDKLIAKNFTKEEIIDYFEFDNMLKKEVDFCPLYAKNKKCHDTKYLNCYLCACPNFRFNDEGIQKVKNKTQYSFCGIDSKDGRQGIYGVKIHQDCTKCTVPHKKEYVLKHFDYEWKKVMHKCIL